MDGGRPDEQVERRSTSGFLVTSYQVGAIVLRPLMRAFWSAQGWRMPPSLPTGRELAAAVSAGVMFAAPRRMAHDGWVEAARAAAAAADKREVEEAFISSLATRRLDLRSALGSYAVARRLPTHPFSAVAASRMCAVCGLPRESEQDLNVLSFERFKWGGVRRDDVRYIAFDLEQFAKAPRDTAGSAALSLGREMLCVLRDAPPGETAIAAAARLTIVKGNTAERGGLIDILGVCGLLAPRDHPGYLDSFVRFADRDSPAQRNVEACYPACWWRGRDGLSEAAIREFLPRLE
ncbi:MAG: hypothetical protein U0990_08470 [Candidatus Nanopelagicales bacterium]|nr:hypothetical protein [Candidatus Nanopelagicales bacterium]MDZ4250110.1 hypothetical protein [Candidatus Nanopelagicales bacterium]